MAPKKEKKANNQSQVINITLNDNQEIELTYDEQDQDNVNGEEITIEGGIKYVVVEEDERNSDDSDETSSEFEEVVEHVCGKCNKSFSAIIDLKKHLPFCRENSEANLRKQEMFQNLEKIEEECMGMEKKDLCFCCNENFDVCHAGHIRCTECPKSFKNSSSFERHIFLTHSDIDKYPCDICNAQCPSEKILGLHRANHQRRGKKYACKKCGKEFTRHYHVVRHTKFSPCDPSVEKTEFACNVCNKVFYRVDNLRNHLRTHLGENNKTRDYQCPFCDKSFYGTSTLNIHIRTHTGERPFSCDLCEKYFPSNAALRKHRRYHTGEKPYECSVCKRTFTAKEVLNRHMKTHTGEKPHSCEICGKSFIQATQLKKHLLNHDEPKGFDCPLCSEKFNRKSKLSKHLIDDHASDVGFNCVDCKSSFKSAAGLKRHVTRMHSNADNEQDSERGNEEGNEGGSERVTKRTRKRASEQANEETFACGICDKQFNDQQSLSFHNVVSHDDADLADDDSIQVIDTWQCSICFRTFKNEVGYNAHMRRAHKSKKSSISNETRILNGTISRNKKKPPKRVREEKITDNNYNIQEFIIEELNVVEGNDPKLNEHILVYEEAHNSDSNIDLKMQELFESDDIEVDDSAKALKTSSENTIKNDDEFNENVSKLLDFLIDSKTLRKFGWPNAPVEEVLQKVILNCGHELAEMDKSFDYSTRMREFVKILFTVVIDNEEIKELLNNLTIDEVIEHVVNMADDDE